MISMAISISKNPMFLETLRFLSRNGAPLPPTLVLPFEVSLGKVSTMSRGSVRQRIGHRVEIVATTLVLAVMAVLMLLLLLSMAAMVTMLALQAAPLHLAWDSLLACLAVLPLGPGTT